jgi:hypothetical protein
VTPRIPYGGPLTAADLEQLAHSGIAAATAQSALLRRVSTVVGTEIMGRDGHGDFAGIIFPYIWPGSDVVREYRLRRDKPEIENGRPKGKYIQPQGRRPMLYFHPATNVDWLSDVSLPILLTEGEKKCLALWQLSWHERDGSEIPEWLSLAISGVQNWKGKIGTVQGPDYPGQHFDEKGPIPDLDRITWKGRCVVIVFDSNVHTNNDVRIARFSLAKELRGRGAAALFIDIPADAGVNGVDDLVGLWGADRVLELLRNPYDPKQKKEALTASKIDIDSIPPVCSYTPRTLEFAVEGLIASGCVTLISGESGGGKSTVVSSMADAIVRGEAFAGRKCTQRKVLILDRENAIEVVKERFERLEITGDGPLVWGGWLDEEAPTPNAAVILDWVQRTEPKPIIVIDTLVTFLEGDENSATDVQKFMEKLRQLANLGAGVIGLHHSGKAETAKDYRGSSYFKGGADVALQLTNFGTAELTKIQLKAFKSRFTIDREIILEYFNGRFASDSRPHAAIRTVTEQLTKLLFDNPSITKTEFEKLAGERGLGRNRARKFLDDGVDVGEIEVKRGQRKTLIYRLISDGLGVQ